MKVNVTHTIDDIADFAVYLDCDCPESCQRRRLRNVLYVIVLLTLVGGLAWRAQSPGGLSSLIPNGPPILLVILSVMVFGSVAGFAWPIVANWPFIIRRRVKRQFRRFPELSRDLERHEVILEEYGIRITGDGFMYFTPWEKITNVILTDDRAYVLFSSNPPEIIRADAFQESEEYILFLKTIRQRRLAAVSIPDNPRAASRHGD